MLSTPEFELEDLFGSQEVDYNASTEEEEDLNVVLSTPPQDAFQVTEKQLEAIHDIINLYCSPFPGYHIYDMEPSQSPEEYNRSTDNESEHSDDDEPLFVPDLAFIEEQLENDDEDMFVASQPLQVFEQKLKKPKPAIGKKNKQKSLAVQKKCSRPAMDPKFRYKLETSGIESHYCNDFIRSYLAETSSTKSTCKICSVDSHSNYQMTPCGPLVSGDKTQCTIHYGLESFVICVSCFKQWVLVQNAAGIMKTYGNYGRYFVKNPLSKMSLFFGGASSGGIFTKHVNVEIFNKKI